MYDLISVVIHCGRYLNYLLLCYLIYLPTSGPTRGHYITIVNSHNHWLSFDDEYVEVGVKLRNF